ncbi:MAG: 2-succinyl-5-enolpyruvyl-6-hydroxy-3-cyclohexene-1-carboxylic-acid synthase [Maribacter sp.]
MKYSSIPTAQAIVQHFQARKISNIIISPGSRNAPLTIAFTENSFFDCYSIVDERCAAFFAMGMAQQLQQPVAVLCTSGSALLNYYPAVAEAYYSNIPLVIISADRPSYKVDIGDGQTIRQENIYHNHIGYSANLRQDVSHATEKVKEYRPEWFIAKEIAELQKEVQSYNDGELNTSLNLAMRFLYPIHINVPLEEPLYNTLLEPSLHASITKWEKRKEDFPDLKQYKDIWNTTDRKMILVGVSTPNTIKSEILELLANDPSVLVLTETTSNIYHPNFFNSIDSIIAPIELGENKEEQFTNLRPGLLVTFGGFIVSKKIKAFLRKYSPDNHWHVGGEVANDTFYCLDEHLKIPKNDFFTEMYAKGSRKESNYFETWDKVKDNYLHKRDSYLEKIPFSDFLVFSEILKSIPKNSQLQLANSSTIRYTQLFELHQSLQVFCNRGTSGIDGSTSTAIGASLKSDLPTVFITGDLSFFYDSNALWNNYIRPDFRIIVVNNSGGGIFRILPGKEESVNFKTFFETEHVIDAKHLCQMYGIEYQQASSTEALEIELKTFYENSTKPKLLEIFTPRLINNKILMDYFHFIP